MSSKPQKQILTVTASAGIVLACSLFSPATQAEETKTPIKHLVVIIQENVSFDHYFGTYPNAANLPGETAFNANPLTPSVNGLSNLLINNPTSLNPKNGVNAINPFRLTPGQASTCDQGHSVGQQQLAFNGGMMDLFPAYTGNGKCAEQYAWGKGNGLVMGYFDGNTVTALWNYAQNFAMSDNYFGSTFGPSTLGALNLAAGNTYPAYPSAATNAVVAGNGSYGTLMSNLQPTGDKCSSASVTVKMGGKNIGDLLNAKGVSWGAFMGGFDLTLKNPDGSTGCARQSPASPVSGGKTKDYIPHHALFQYYASTANPNHTRPTVPPGQYGSSADTLTHHQYDLQDFFAALSANNLPAVSFLRAPASQDGHAGYSDPLLEQTFLVNTINTLQKSNFWPETAIIITYDDSDGWYDHQMSSIINPSSIDNPKAPSVSDQLDGPGKCGSGTPLKDDTGNPINGRCGYGPRLPLLVISPYARKNYVDHTLTNQASVLQLIEDNWNTGRIGNGSFDEGSQSLVSLFDFQNKADNTPLLLNPNTGNADQLKLECFFTWAQANYSTYLSPDSAVTQHYTSYTYRYYSKTNAYLGLSDIDYHLYYLTTGAPLTDLGALSGWLGQAGC